MLTRLMTYLYLPRADRERGQTMAEYAVVLAVIAIGIFVALGHLGSAISGSLDKVATNI